MRFVHAARATACLAAFSLPVAASAEETGEATIIVTAAARADTAARSMAATPGGTGLVRNSDYADRVPVSLRDVLAFSPGVYLQPRFGQEVRISIRGSGLSRGFHMRGLTLLQDGIPINLADDNGDFQELEPAFLDHLEVYRGANALRLGSGTLGGAINGVTPAGDNAKGIYARLDAGSFNMWRGLLSAGFGDDAANAWLALGMDSHDGDRDHAKRDSIRFHGNAGFRLSEGVSTRFYASVNMLDQELPGALTLATALAAPETGNFAGDQARDINSLRVQNRTSVDLGMARLAAGVFLNAKQLYHPIFQAIDQKSTDRGMFARLDFASGPVEFTLGGDSRWGDIASKRFVNANGRRGAQTFNADQSARTSNLYAELRYQAAEMLTLVAGAIYADGVRRQDQIVPAAVTGQASFDALSPKLGLLASPADGIQLFANYSRSVEFPTFVELAQVAAFVPVREQRAWTMEVGTRGTRGGISWDIAFYRADVTGEMLQFTVAPNIPASTFNAGKTRHQGIEVGLGITATDWLRLRQIWQYSDFAFRGDPQFGNNRLPVVPENLLRTEVRIGSDARHISANIEWVPGGAWADYRNTMRAPGYALLGLAAATSLRPGLDLFLDVRNLANKRAAGDISAVVAANAGSAIYYPVERRAVYGGVRARF